MEEYNYKVCDLIRVEDPRVAVLGHCKWELTMQRRHSCH